MMTELATINERPGQQRGIVLWSAEFADAPGELHWFSDEHTARLMIGDQVGSVRRMIVVDGESESWHLAGVFYGLLFRKLGYGLLVMTSPTAAHVLYQWDIVVDGKRFNVEQELSFTQLRQLRLEELATAWAENWRSMLHRRD